MVLFRLLNRDMGPFMDRLMVLVSRVDIIYVFFATLALLLLWRRGRAGLAAAFVALGLVGLSDLTCARVLKPFFARPRPYAVLSGVRVFKGGRFRVTERPLAAEHYGFPSCHATNTSAAAGFLSTVDPALAPAALGFTLLVGVSRVYLGHHFPGDVLFGWLVGGFLGLSGGLIWRKLVRRGS